MKKLFTFLLSLVISIGYSQTTFTVNLTSPGSGSWVVPCTVTSITVQCWGGGGAGGSATVDKTGAGGGGAGGYGTSVYAVTPGANISYTVGSGGVQTATNSTSQAASGTATTFSSTIANGGTGGNWGGNGASGGTFGTGGAGGTAVGTTTTTGGAGANGTAGASSTGGSGGNAGGSGGTGGASSSGGAGGSGNPPGGGGGGGSQQAGPGGLGNFGAAGGDGQITIIYRIGFTANAGADITLATCTTTNVTLAASTLSAGTTGLWSTSASSISITNPTQTNATAAGAGFTEGSSISFIWTVASGTCSISDEVIVTVPTCAQTNSTCATAMSLTANAALKCGQSTSLTVGDGTDGCKISGSGQAVWYKITATNDSMVLNVLGTSAYYPNYGIFKACPTDCATPANNVVSYSLSAGILFNAVNGHF